MAPPQTPLGDLTALPQTPKMSAREGEGKGREGEGRGGREGEEKGGDFAILPPTSTSWLYATGKSLGREWNFEQVCFEPGTKNW